MLYGEDMLLPEDEDFLDAVFDFEDEEKEPE